MFTRRRPLAERFWEKVDNSAGPEGCWPWTASLNRGYGQFYIQGGQPPAKAHRLAYELTVGPIPDGLILDHLCHSQDQACRGGDDCPHRRCVNPAHLDPVPDETNILRGRSVSAGHALKTHCFQGHEFTPENTRTTPEGKRVCRACHRQRENKRYREGRKIVHGPRRNQG